MECLKNPKYRAVFIISVLVILSIFTFWIRIIPFLQLGNGDILNLVGSDDPLYNLRQIESLLANFPNYEWFDPMTTFPTGEIVYWGPLLTYSCAMLCIIFGATTRPEIIQVSLFVPVLMAVVMVPVMYWLGKTLGDWKTGLLSALMISVVSGQYFFRSYYGYLDHHIAEVLFAVIFCAVYVYALTLAKEREIKLSDISTYRDIVIVSALGGVAFFLGYLAMPTIIVFGLIVGAFTFIQCVINHYRDRSSRYLAIINTTVFGVQLILMLIYGFKHEGFELSRYTLGQFVAYFLLIVATLFLYGLSIYLQKKDRNYFLLILAGVAIVLLAFISILAPTLFNNLVAGLNGFFGQAPVTETIQEARGWDLVSAWNTFNYGIILALIGGIIFLYQNLKREEPGQVFVLVWSLVMLYSSWQHIRYEYYLAANVALLSAIGIGAVLSWGYAPVSSKIGIPGPCTGDKDTPKEPEKPGKSKDQKHGKKIPAKRSDGDILPIAGSVIVIVLALMFIYSSLSYSYAISSGKVIWANQDWKESLTWMGNNTPDTGVDYYAIYDMNTFQYPSTAYGVMSWWDYGHQITYIAKRIPNANPFQRNVIGPNGSAAYFLAESEDTANTILNNMGTRYVVTDIEMDSFPNGKFWAMATWYNGTAAISPYLNIYSVSDPSSASGSGNIVGIDADYYLTMISRLHNFDGSMTAPSKVYYVESSTSAMGNSYPEIYQAKAVNYTQGLAEVKSFNANATSGMQATLVSTTVVYPTVEVPALKHYRLVHESPTNVFDSTTLNVKYVKIFEYVNGAVIKGTGIIEVPVVTNTGRTFTYRQTSENGTFIVPYATTGWTGEVKTTGKYHIVGTNQYFDVSEDAIESGKTIN